MATAKVIIKGENQIGSAVKSAQSDLTGFSQAAQKAGEFLKKAFTVTAVVAALKKLGDACTACFNDFSQANRAYKQLSLSMKDQSAYKSVIANIDKLSRQTLSSKDEIEAMVSELAALGKSADEINRISDAAVALSNVTGKDLNSSMTTLLNTYNGTTKQLNKLGIDTSNLTKHQLENGAAVDVVIQKFGKLSQAMAEADTSQHIQNIKNTWGDIKQQIGGILDYNFGPMFANLDNGLNQSFSKITGVINYIGAVIANFREVLSRTMTLLGEIILKIFSWDFISGSIETSFQNILTLIGGVFTALEKATGGFFSWSYHCIMSDLYDILAWLPEQLENLIENIVNGIADSWLGDLFKMKEVSLNFGSSFLKDKGRQHFSQALQSKQDMDIRGAVSEISNTLKTVSSDTAEFLNSQFKDLLTEFGTDIDTIVAPDLEKIQTAADATAHAVDGTTAAVETIDKELKKGTFLDKLSDRIALWSQGWSGAESGQASSFGEGVISAFCDKMGEAGELISKLAANMASMGPILGAIVTALEYVFEGLNQIIGSVLTDIVEYGLEPLRELGRVIGDLLLPVLEALAPHLEKIMEFSKILFNAIGTVLMPVFEMIAKIVEALTPVFDVLIDVITVIAEVLQSIAVILESVLSPVLDSIVSIIKGALAPVLELIAAILEVLSPILKVFAKIVVTITGTIQYVVQVLHHWVATVCNWLADLSIFGWHPFSGLSMNDPGSPGRYGDFIQSKWDAIDKAFEGAQTPDRTEEETETSTSTSTSLSSASYRGATQVTINIYQQAPVVGDMGMRAFAQMIHDQFTELEYFGVTA